MRPTVEKMGLVREIQLAFARWTVPAMTTAEQASTAPRPTLRALAAVEQPHPIGSGRVFTGLVITAVLLGSQTLAASAPPAQRCAPAVAQ